MFMTFFDTILDLYGLFYAQLDIKDDLMDVCVQCCLSILYIFMFVYCIYCIDVKNIFV